MRKIGHRFSKRNKERLWREEKKKKEASKEGWNDAGVENMQRVWKEKARRKTYGGKKFN